MKTNNYSNLVEAVHTSHLHSKSTVVKYAFQLNLKKLFTLLAVIAITSFFTTKADWVKNVTLTN
jgi:hypothetical protein